jgi:hypothetical protein
MQFSANVVVSPWIRSLGVHGKRISKYMFCKNCVSGFFDYRYSDNEMSKIYKNYRGENYLNTRYRWEPWYNKAFNEEHDSPEYISMRKESLHKFLINFLPVSLKTVIDIGGDRGQYIPNFGQAESYVIESSSKKLASGVKRLASLAEISRCDLLIYSHVLEHVANPRREVQTLLQYCEYLYVEVPFGVPTISKYRTSKSRFLLKLFASCAPVLWRKFSKPSTGRKSQQGVLVQSEHINFFSENSFRELADSLNLEVHIEVNSIKTPDKAEALVIQCLFIPQKLTSRS